MSDEDIERVQGLRLHAGSQVYVTDPGFEQGCIDGREFSADVWLDGRRTNCRIDGKHVSEAKYKAWRANRKEPK